MLFYSILELQASKEKVSVLETKVQTLQKENVGKLWLDTVLYHHVVTPCSFKPSYW